MRRISLVSASPLELFSAYLDGHALSDAQVVQLRAWISASPEHAEEFVRIGSVHAALADRMVLGRLLEELATHSLSIVSPETLAEAIRDIEATSPRATSAEHSADAEIDIPRSSRWLIPLAAAAAVAFISLGFWAIQTAPAPSLANPDSRQFLAHDEATALLPSVVQQPVVAQVGPLLDAHWTFDNGSKSGDRLREGTRLDLLEGVVQLDMISGATVVLEGPCHVELQSPNSLRLADGKAAVRINGAAESFVINTPTALVTDLGTEFGVKASPSSETLVSVFEGRVDVGLKADGMESGRGKTGISDRTLSPGDAVGNRRIEAGYELSVTRLAGGAADFGQPLAVKNDRAFIRPDEVDVRLRAAAGSSEARKLAAHYARLRMAGLLAYQNFDAASAGLEYAKGFGPQGLITAASANCVDDGAHMAGVDVQGGDAFLMLNASGEGPFAQAGVIGPTGLIGQSGTELWMTWRTQRFDVAAERTDSAGLSLMFGERNDVDEPLFVGHAAFGGVFCAQSAWGGGPPPGGKRITAQVDFDAAAPGVQSRVIDDQPHTWVMRLNFADDKDRVSIWVDQEPATLNSLAPQAILDVSQIEFDRVRLATHRGSETWRFGHLVVGRDLETLAALSRLAAKKGLAAENDMVSTRSPRLPMSQENEPGI
jgi:hypothetical protein